jgi:hypothetical protein
MGHAPRQFMFVFVFSAALVVCLVWFEAWRRMDVARIAAVLKLAVAVPSATRPNRYSSIVPRVES